jgi:hypothetical protein
MPLTALSVYPRAFAGTVVPIYSLFVVSVFAPPLNGPGQTTGDAIGPQTIGIALARIKLRARLFFVTPRADFHVGRTRHTLGGSLY